MMCVCVHSIGEIARRRSDATMDKKASSRINQCIIALFTFTFIIHHPSFIIHHSSSFIILHSSIIHHHSSSFIIIHHPSFIIIHHHSSPCISMHFHASYVNFTFIHRSQKNAFVFEANKIYYATQHTPPPQYTISDIHQKTQHHYQHQLRRLHE